MSNFYKLEERLCRWDKQLTAWLKKKTRKTPKQKKKELKRRCAQMNKLVKNYVSPEKWQETYEKAFQNTMGFACKGRMIWKLHCELHQSWTLVKDYVSKRYQHSVKKERIEWMQKLNYVFTFTYDDKKHTERSFRRELRKVLFKLGWEYIGVWKRGSTNGRLCFYATIYIKGGGMVGMNVVTKAFQRKVGRRVKVIKNTYFGELFGATVVNPLRRENRKLWRIVLGEINKKRARVGAHGIDKATFIGDYEKWMSKRKQRRKT